MPAPTNTLSLLPKPADARLASQAAGSTSSVAEDRYVVQLDDDACVIRAILVESIDSLFPLERHDDDTAENDPMAEPVLDYVLDPRVQFVGQMAAPPRARRRQRLVPSRAVLHTTVRRTT